MDSGRSIQHEISSLKGTPLTYILFWFLRLSSSPSRNRRSTVPGWHRVPSQRCNINNKLYSGRFLAGEPSGGFLILGSFAFLQSFADKRNEKLLSSVLCRREQGLDGGARGNNCAETVYLMCVSACGKDSAGGRMRQEECVLQ